MKKEYALIFGLIFTIALAFVFALNISCIHAAGIDPANAEDPLGIGVNPENVPQTPEDMANVSSNYLKQEWGKIIVGIPVIGEIHSWFLVHPTIFKIIFGEPYSFSLTFICILFLWLFIFIWTCGLVNSYLKYLGIFIGLGFVILLAQLGAIGGIVRVVLKLLLGQNSWWVRAIIWILVIAIIVILFYLDSLLSNYIKQKKKENKEKKIETEAEASKEFIEGVKEGESLTKDIRKLKRKEIGLK